MKTTNIVLMTVIFFAAPIAGIASQMHYAAGDKVSRAGNRLMSVKSEPGRLLYQPDRKAAKKNITIDGQMEQAWDNAQIVSQFADEDGNKEQTTIRVFFDDENIYLFWQLSEQESITANVKEEDTVITGDDYAQINLRPWLADDIKFARNYYYTIAVNPAGTVWDAYWEPYHGGYFFSSWDSQSQISTSQSKNGWSAEMKIPFSGLDHTSDPGQKWNLDFLHASRINDTESKVYTAETGLSVRQGVMVRRSNMVGYYWTRPEYMMEVKPGERKGEFSVRPTNIKKLPALDGKPDAGIWAEAQAIQIDHSDRMGEKLAANTARARTATMKNYLCFQLEADGAKTQKGKAINDTDTGMGYQIRGINGVYVDKSLFTTECFWLILQPRKPDTDIVHQPYYLVKVSNNGEVKGVRYDCFGVPDRSWRPQATIDIYDTDTGWGAEIAVTLSSFDLPAECQNEWGFNLFRCRLLPLKGTILDSELQAWAYTASDFLNPKTFGELTDITIDQIKDVKPTLERKISALRQKIETQSAGHKELADKMLQRLDEIKLTTGADLAAAAQRLEQIDNKLGVIEAEQFYDAHPHPARGGYGLFDVQLIGDNGWAVGPIGTILRTEDGGKNWKPVDIETDADLYRVYFVNEKQGWAAGGRIRMAQDNKLMRHDENGGYGYIYHTQDGGKTWACQYAERGRLILGLHFIDKNTGFACGERGILLKTEDGGKNWLMQPTTNTKRWLYGIIFKDKNNGFIVGESETVLKTANGGETWVKVNAPADRQFYGFRSFYRDIDFAGSTGCIVGQNGTVLISNDGGESWRPAATFIEPEIREFLDYTSVDFVTEKQGYVVGELGTRLLITDDGGQSWTLRKLANKDWLRAVWADEKGKVILTGEREKVLVSKDKGLNFRTVRTKDEPKTDILIFTAHGDDSPIRLGSLMVHYGINEGKNIVDIEVIKDAHSVEYYGEIYNLEHHRDIRLSGIRTTTYFDEFENGNNGCDFYHQTTRLWQGEQNAVRHMVAAIRAYRPDIIITHDPVYGEYDKPGHKLAGRAGLDAFDTAGGETDHWPELTQIGLEPWQPKKFYCLASETYPATIDVRPIGKIPLKGTDQTCWEYAQYIMRVFLSQGIHNVRDGELSLVRSNVGPAFKKEKSIFEDIQ